jgi:hypothetical protein
MNRAASRKRIPVSYFDDLAATLIPEPTSLALPGLGAAALLIFRRRR